MVNVPATVAAALVVVLFGVALVTMTTGDFAVAGACFMSASVLIYLRETRLVSR
ncbi:hypothetical protein [Halomarina ordinaria]|uniref:Uncharacterized protein n=1 Tax=Halomarina ordinaria TaxID=3033939 RepID=A0ABD5UGR9_9EURY|nr:hypothetical protein [Halomarina sp. PSRA2]